MDGAMENVFEAGGRVDACAEHERPEQKTAAIASDSFQAV